MVHALIRTLTSIRIARITCALFVIAVTSMAAQGAHAAGICDNGVWVDAMIGSHHVHPDKDFEQFNPGIGVECWVAPQWIATAGYFRNSLSKPSFYGGGVWAPEFAHWGFVRLAVMGGVISGYNYGKWSIGHNSNVGPVAAPLIMAEYKHIGANIILIPPIPSSDLPFTIGFQLRVRF
jgi:hypothetical protein